ncbi:MAG: TonB-dependent receptor [bacterium]|nr:TonB-dependent receptor [bacterium]
MRSLLRTLTILLCVRTLFAAEQLTGTISGIVVDTETQEPVIGAALMIKGTQLGAAADLEGRFTISNVPAGIHALSVSAIGYAPIVYTDVNIRPARATTLTLKLAVLAIENAEVTIRPRYFTTPADAPANTTVLAYEEIRRAPGTVGDVSRVLMSLPSVSKVNDTRNNLIVRGGSPMENGYSIDGIEVPNINHFPLQGAASGALGMIQVDLLEDATFQAGGFGVEHGERLSSVMELALRAGDRERVNGQFNLNLLGVGGVLDGPLANKRGSFLVAANRSYFDFVVDAFNVEASAVPWYSDLLGKVVYDLSPRNQLTMLDLAGRDHSHIARTRAQENDENVYGTADWTVNTLGANWRHLWGPRGYSNTSVAHTYTNWQSKWSEVSEAPLSATAATEHTLTLRSDHRFRVSKRMNVSCGSRASAVPFDYDRVYFATTDLFGNAVPELRVRKAETAMNLGGYLSAGLLLTPRLTFTPGARVDHQSYTGQTTFAPRAQVTYDASDATTLSASCGLYQQALPYVLLSQNEQFKELSNPFAVHYVLGASHLVNDETRLTIEAYHKHYEHLSLDPAQAEFSVLDQTNDQDGFTAHELLLDNGHAFSTGIELMIQKKLVERLYGSVSGSYSRARYRDYSGVWRDRIYDNRYLATLIGGYKPDQNWDLSLRWIFAGGAPYTPLDLAASTAANRAVYDYHDVNSERLPAYHTLDIRADRRFTFGSANGVVFLAIQNLYARENISSYYWNQNKNEPATYKQWGLLPLMGIEIEF